MNNQSLGGSKARPVGRVAMLCGKDGCVYVEPTAGDTGVFTRFLLPRVHSGMTATLTQMVNNHRDLHGRCMAAMLLLDVRTRMWEWRVPWQRCWVSFAAWQPDRVEGLALGGDLRLAGSFQSVAENDPAEVLQHVPPIVGIHFIVHRWQGENVIWAFLHLNETVVINFQPEDLVTDDMTGMLATHAERLRIV